MSRKAYSGEKERLIDGVIRGRCFCDNLLWILLTWRVLSTVVIAEISFGGFLIVW